MTQPGDKTIMISLRVPEDWVRMLDALAYLRTSTRTSVISKAIREYLVAHRDELTAEAFEKTIQQHKQALEDLANL